MPLDTWRITRLCFRSMQKPARDAQKSVFDVALGGGHSVENHSTFVQLVRIGRVKVAARNCSRASNGGWRKETCLFGEAGRFDKITEASLVRQTA